MVPISQVSSNPYELALEAAGLGIIDNNIEEGLVTCSPFCYEVYGLDRSEPASVEKIFACLHPDDRFRAEEKFTRALDPDLRMPYEIEYRIVRPGDNAVIRWVRARGRGYFNEEGKPVRFVVTVQDITPEVHSRSTHQKLLALVENSVELMSVLELDGKNSYLNIAGIEMLGFDSFEQVLRTPISDLHEPEDIAFVEANVLPSVMQSGRWSGRMKVRHLKSGIVFWVHNNTIRIDDPQTGEPIAIGAVMRDLRPEMEAQEALEEGKRELERRVEERTAELLRKNRELEEYTYVTSHDLQEPLRKIRLFADLIREEEFEKMSAQSQLRFDKITASVERLSRALRDLLNFSNLSQEELSQPVAIEDVIHNACTDLELLIAEKQGQIEIGSLPVIRAVPHQLHQVFYNLLSNALKFAHSERLPRIRIQTTDAPDGQPVENFQWLLVEDNGIGFAPSSAEKIFGLFQRLHAQHEYSGSGIGLALCRKVMRNHGGEIIAEGVPGVGARFYLGFPLSPVV